MLSLFGFFFDIQVIVVCSIILIYRFIDFKLLILCSLILWVLPIEFVCILFLHCLWLNDLVHINLLILIEEIIHSDIPLFQIMGPLPLVACLHLLQPEPFLHRNHNLGCNILKISFLLPSSSELPGPVWASHRAVAYESPQRSPLEWSPLLFWG